MSGGGNLIAFDLGSAQAAFAFLNALEIIDISNNLGDAKSMATHPTTTTHRPSARTSGWRSVSPPAGSASPSASKESRISPATSARPGPGLKERGRPARGRARRPPFLFRPASERLARRDLGPRRRRLLGRQLIDPRAVFAGDADAAVGFDHLRLLVLAEGGEDAGDAFW